MHNLYRHAIADFEVETGTPYDDTAYPTPESVPSELRKLVANIKMFGASARQLEIQNELIEFSGESGVVVVPDNKRHLMEEMEACKISVELWATHVNQISQ